MLDLREIIAQGGESDGQEAERKVQSLLKHLEDYETDCLQDLKDVISKEKANGDKAVNNEPQPGTSAQSEQQAAEPQQPQGRVLRPRVKPTPAPPAVPAKTKTVTEEKTDNNKKADNASDNRVAVGLLSTPPEQIGEVRERIQAMVQRRQQEGINLQQALHEAIAQGGDNAEMQARLQPILMRLDTDELTAMHRILEVLHGCVNEGLNPEQVEHRLQNIVDRQREDENNALEAMQAVVATPTLQGMLQYSQHRGYIKILIIGKGNCVFLESLSQIDLSLKMEIRAHC